MSFIERFRDATIGFSGYARLARDRAGGFGFMALILAAVMAISGVIATTQAKAAFRLAAQSLASSPDFSLQNGQLNFEGQMPYRIDQGNGAFIIVDTTGQTTPAVLNGAPYGSLLITKTAYYSLNFVGQTQTMDFSQFPITVGKNDIIALMGNAHWAVVAAYVVMYPFQLGFKSFDAVVLALFATMMASSLKRKVSFDIAWKIGLYAVTLPTIIQWIFPGFSTTSRLGFGIWWLLAILYAVMGMRAYLTGAEPVE